MIIPKKNRIYSWRSVPQEKWRDYTQVKGLVEQEYTKILNIGVPKNTQKVYKTRSERSMKTATEWRFSQL